MFLFSWIVRGILLLVFFPLLLPLGWLASFVLCSPLALALFILSLALLSLGIVLGIALGVIGRLVDLILVLSLIGLVWKWPRGIRASFWDKLRLAYRGLRNSVREQIRRCSPTDFALCIVIALIALVLSLSSGFLQFLFTAAVVLLAVGIVWKWPTASTLPFSAKLRISLHELKEEIRRRFR
jgi:hypothetical protein